MDSEGWSWQQTRGWPGKFNSADPIQYKSQMVQVSVNNNNSKNQKQTKHTKKKITCHIGGIWAPKPNTGNILSLHKNTTKH